MATEIKVWQIEDKELTPIDTSMAKAGRTESKDLEQWIKSHPDVLGEDLLIIGEQVQTKSGPLDLLAVDKSGAVVIIELKRDLIPRQALAQAIDYASRVASWDIDELGKKCQAYIKGQSLESYINERFESVDSVNQTQRILLVGTFIEESLQLMIEWLSENISINAVILKYIKTKSGDELVARTMIVPKEREEKVAQRQQRRIPMSDEQGSHEDDKLKVLLERHLSKNRNTPRFIKEILLPLCLDHEPVTRDELKKELVKRGKAVDEGKAGRILAAISKELGFERHDYLRQVILYSKLEGWRKENYRIEEKYKDMIRGLISE